VGVIVALLATLFIGDFFTQKPHKFLHPTRYLWFLVYVPLFVWECFKANVDVAFRVIHPKRPIRPGIVKVKTSLRSDTALTFLANSITLTPGTLTVDVDKENGCLYVHWINVRSTDIEEATKRIVGRFERILKRIFE
jgi:multicomponent Na+:H+ antiporter subunit E